MEENINLKEIAIILGLKNNSDELNKIIIDTKSQNFLGTISDILYSDNLKDIYNNNEIKEDNDNTMIDNFIKKAEIDNICPVKLEIYKDSNFIDSIKGNDNLLRMPKIDYSESYLTKLQNDFVKEEEVKLPPIEIKEEKNDRNEDTKFSNNKKNFYNKKNTKTKNNKDENNNNKENENVEIQKKKESENEFEKEEDKKEIKENNDKQTNEIEYEEDEKYDDKKNTENNNYHHNNNRPYNKKYNKNKGHKEFRQKLSSRKFKNYK
jgi:hypothetical protein